MNVTVIGAGYVGLVSAACFAEFGFSVTCVDREERKIATLKHGKIPIYEPGLDQIVHSNYQAGRLTFTTDLVPAVAGSGQPSVENGQSADENQVSSTSSSR